MVAQEHRERPEFHAFAGTMDYQGDYADEFYSFTHGIVAGQGMNWYLDRSFNAGFDMNFGWVKGDNAGPRGNKGVLQFASFQAEMINLDLLVKYKFNNDYLLKKSSRVCPWLDAGLGVLYATTTGINSRLGDFYDDIFTENFCLGAGIECRISSKIGIYLRSQLLLPLSDKIDGWYPAISANHNYDQFMINSIGLTFTPGK